MFCYTVPPNWKLEKNWKEIVWFTPAAGWLTNLPRFQEARPDHVRVESACCCFPRELVSFDPRHVTRSPPIRKRIWVGGITISFTAFKTGLNPAANWLTLLSTNLLTVSATILTKLFPRSVSLSFVDQNTQENTGNDYEVVVLKYISLRSLFTKTRESATSLCLENQHRKS